jgi:hypothetical protein
VRPELRELELADPPEAWEALGFAVRRGTVGLGGMWLRLGAPGAGIVGWTLAGVSGDIDLDGLPTRVMDEAVAGTGVRHDNGAIGLDHVVVLTPDFERTSTALEAAGLALRRVRELPAAAERPALRQGFRRLGPAILELVEAPGGASTRFWGLTLVVADLDALAARLGDRLGPVREAVQPGRRIATLRESAGLGQPVAFMDPEPGR